MNSSNEDCIAISNRIVFDGQLEAVLRRHTGLISWTVGESSPVFGVKDNGTFCFIQTHQKRFLLTCSHIWKGFEKEKASGVCLWISLILNDNQGSPSIPFLARNPILIDEDTRLDLATITFDEIDTLESWRFHYLAKPSKCRLIKGSPACFIAYTGEGLREGESQRVLNYSLFTLTVNETGQTKFLLHDKSGSCHLFDKAGNEIAPIKMGGASGAPIFSFDSDLKLWLAGVVCEISSPGLLSCETSTNYEMSDGDIYAAYVDFVQTDGTIRMN
jgi:hypothetical protein